MSFAAQLRQNVMACFLDAFKFLPMLLGTASDTQELAELLTHMQ